MNFIKLMNEKYGSFIVEKTYKGQIPISDERGDGYYNVLFSPVKKNEYKFTQDLLGWKFPSELEKIYQECNGMVLFDEKLEFFGIKNGDSEAYNPSDMILRNSVSKLKYVMPNCENMIIIGTYDGLLICYSRLGDLVQIINMNKKKIISTYKNIDELLCDLIKKNEYKK